MTTSKHVALRAAVAALLTAAPALASGNIHQNRAFVLANGVASQLHVNLESSFPLHLHLGIDSPEDWETTFELRILARKNGAVEAADVADALWTDAYARLMADQTLGGLAWDLITGEMNTDPDEADTSLCTLTWRFTVKHRTTNNAIS